MAQWQISDCSIHFFLFWKIVCILELTLTASSLPAHDPETEMGVARVTSTSCEDDADADTD